MFLLALIPYLQPFIDVNKRVGRLAANIPLLKANVCPMSYRDMDKERYAQGLLAFYELNRPEILVRAYVDAYEQGREVHPLEIQYFRELKQCVADYIRQLADSKGGGHPAAYARAHFNALPDVQREWLAERVAEVILALHEGNIIAWGVDRETWQRYALLGFNANSLLGSPADAAQTRARGQLTAPAAIRQPAPILTNTYSTPPEKLTPPSQIGV